LRFTLRDWNRIWFLSFLSESKLLSGTEVSDSRTAFSIVSHLIRDRGNHAVIREFLSSRGGRAVPEQIGPLLLELERRFARGECVLLRGVDMRAGGGQGRKAPEEAPLEVWDFTPAESPEEEAPAVEEALPSIRFSGGSEAPVMPRFGGGSEGRSVLAFAYASEGGPAFALGHAAEPQHAFGNSVSVEAPD
jgi:hypothetical protein